MKVRERPEEGKEWRKRKGKGMDGHTLLAVGLIRREGVEEHSVDHVKVLIVELVCLLRGGLVCCCFSPPSGKRKTQRKGEWRGK